MSAFQPRVIHKSDPTKLVIDWVDGHSTTYSAARLRGLCPCALCVNEVTHVRMHDSTSVSADLTQGEARLVGNYAVALRFSDGHHTGIYSFRFLRENDSGG